MTKLRWFVICDKFGRKTKPELQYWNSVYNQWLSVNYVECKTHETVEYLSNEDAIR